MYTLFIVMHVLVSLLLIGAVLIQSGRGAASANIFGGNWSTENVFGAATPAILNRITTILAAAFIVTSLALTTLSGRFQRSVIKQMVHQPAVPDQGIPVPEPTVPLETLPTVPAQNAPVSQPAPAQKAPIPQPTPQPVK